MNPEIHAYALGAPQMSVLLLGTAGVAILHTLAGPDHYLPFIVMGRARRWSVARTVFWTTLCGLGHVASSVLLAVSGVVFGFGLERVRFIEEFRGNLAAWAMIAFGLVYLAWGLNKAVRHAPQGHAHAAGAPEGFRLTPWVLFTIFLFGPCEPMIPLVMYPAAQGSWADVWLVVAAFSVLTVGVMVTVVLLGQRGLGLLPVGRLERFRHAMAGGTVLLAGCAIQFLGL
jgi:nickel/cobalt exporter